MKNNVLFITIKHNLITVWLRIVFERILESFQYATHIGTSNQRTNLFKKQAELQIQTHALEKGMSIGNVKMGFGKLKALALIADLSDFLDCKGCKDFVIETASVLRNYIDFNIDIGADMTDIANAFDEFCRKYKIEPSKTGGVYTLNFQDVFFKKKFSFGKFSQSRYSIRDFGDIPLEINKVKEALTLCEKTPSACNRQSWRIHIYTDKILLNKVFKLQGGCNGFNNQMQCAILICGDLRNYAFYEQSLPFVDGGLYAMNLLYALHDQELATIPLTMSHKRSYTNKIRIEMKLPNNEIPILLIGVGTFKNEYKVAVSHRYPYENYVKFNL